MDSLPLPTRALTCAVQPGGSVRDAEVIAAADERNMAVVFTAFATSALMQRGGRRSSW